MEAEKTGEEAERFEAEDEGEFIRKMNDPRLPSREEIERHCIGGHVEYRDWCDMCVRARGRDMPIVGTKERQGRYQNTAGTIVFQVMSLVTNGRY